MRGSIVGVAVLADQGAGGDRRVRRGILAFTLMVSFVAVALSGCIVVPGYATPAPVYVAPAPVYVAPAPVYVWHGWGWHRGYHWR